MKSFRDIVNEGTEATITVFDGKIYKTSFLQYDGASAGREILAMYNNAKSAQLLVQNSGEIRDIFELEYYTDRNILAVTKNKNKAIKSSNEFYIKYYFDGTSWYNYKGQIEDFEQMDIM